MRHIGEHELLVRGRGLRYLDSGPPVPAHVKTPTFVLLHGLGGCSRHWLAVMGLLGAQARVLAFDLPGFGASRPLSTPLTLDLLADVVAEAMTALDLGPVVLAGHSFAGPLGIRVAVRHPETVARLVLVGGAVFQFSALLGLRDVGRYLRARPRQTLAILAEVIGAGLPLPLVVSDAISRSVFARRAVLWPYLACPAELTPELAALLLSGVGARGVWPTVRAVGGSDPLEGVDEVRCPILSLAGSRDLIVPLADTRRLEQAVCRAETVVFEGCGHLPMLERPAELAQRLLEFANTLSTIDQAPRGASL